MGVVCGLPVLWERSIVIGYMASGELWKVLELDLLCTVYNQHEELAQQCAEIRGQ